VYRFEIWSPFARSLRVRVDGADLPMEGPDPSGSWSLEVSDAHAGSDYGYLVDDDPTCYPDPRSQWQPSGVHGLSRVYDQGRFPWTDASFQAPPLASAVVYELHIGTFTPEGTLDGAIPKLGYLANLGITHVELMPLASFAGRNGWGYDGVSLFAVHEPYGGPDALKRFVNAAHDAGLSVLLDVVYNHFGPVGNYTGKFAPYLTESHRTPWGGAVNLEESGAREVRRFFGDNAAMWLRDFHIDGLRLDAVHALVDRSAIHFLEQLATEVELLGTTLGRPLELIAESDSNDPRIVTQRESGGFGINAQWSDDFHHALFAVLSHGPADGYYADFGLIGQLAKALEETFVYDGVFSTYRNRVQGKSAAHLSAHRFLGYIQNHDQVGNRPLGERIDKSAGMDRARIAAALVFTGPFIPMIFQGEEWAASTPFQYFADHDDPAMARAVSEGRRNEFSAFGWAPESIPDPEHPQTFEQSKLDWNELSQPDHREMLEWYRRLIALRRTTACLNDGEPRHTKVVFSEIDKRLSMTRGTIAVHCNLGRSEQTFHVPSRSEIVLSSRKGLAIERDELVLPPDTVAVIRANENSE
jgi:maltooligosyltrehalose trehalohydrolase